jgi:uncharacterized protein YjbI with pentapeptide repeats
MSKDAANADLEFELKKLLLENMNLFDRYQWPIEDLRWTELVLSLLLAQNKKHQDRIRELVVTLDSLELLDVEDLAGIPTHQEGIDMNYTHARRIYDILNEFGFNYEESQASIITLHEAAANLKQYHDGKVQKYLRKYGDRMVREVPQNFTFSRLSDRDSKYAFTFWFQNVLNMPISLEDENVLEFCKEFRVSFEQLQAEIDKLGANLGLFDDIIRARKLSKSASPEVTGYGTKATIPTGSVEEDLADEIEPAMEQPSLVVNEHLRELLLQSEVEQFNKEMDKENEGFIRLDLRNLDLESKNLSNVMLRGSDLSGSNLKKIRLENAVIVETNLSQTNLENSNLKQANLSGSDLSQARLTKTNLEYAYIPFVNFAQADLSDSKVSGADASDSIFTQAALSDAEIQNSNLFECDFSDANLSNSNLSGANLSGANLSGANLSGANLSEAILSGVQLDEKTVLKNTKLNDCRFLPISEREAERRGAKL